MEAVQKNWSIHSVIKVVGKAKTFSIGKEKLKDVEYMSDLSTDSNPDKLKKSRHQRASKRPASSSSSDELDNDEETYPNLPPTFSGKKPNMNAVNNVIANDEGSINNVGNTVHTPKRTLLPLNTPPHNSPQGSSPSTCHSKSQEEPWSLDDQGQSRNILKSLHNITVYLNANAQRQKVMLKKLENIDKQIEDLKATAERCNEPAIENIDGMEDVTLLFPIKSDEGFAELEEKLVDPTFKAKVVKHFSLIGGKDVKTITYNMFHGMLSNKIAIEYSWFGAKGKKGLHSTKVYSYSRYSACAHEKCNKQRYRIAHHEMAFKGQGEVGEGEQEARPGRRRRN